MELAIYLGKRNTRKHLLKGEFYSTVCVIQLLSVPTAPENELRQNKNKHGNSLNGTFPKMNERAVVFRGPEILKQICYSHLPVLSLRKLGTHKIMTKHALFKSGFIH